MSATNEISNTQVKAQPVSKGQTKKMKNEAALPVASKLPMPGKSLTHQKAVERVFKKNSELFHRLAK